MPTDTSGCLFKSMKGTTHELCIVVFFVHSTLSHCRAMLDLWGTAVPVQQDGKESTEGFIYLCLVVAHILYVVAMQDVPFSVIGEP
jgi:hypothetical protein